MEIGEGISVTSASEPDQKKKKKDEITIRCLMFFDGTLNNKKNIEERQKGSDIYLNNRKNPGLEKRLAAGAAGIDLEDDSYENDFSNIVTLEQNIAPQQEGYSERIKVYTEGAGTMDHGSDDQDGYAFAKGITGIKQKVMNGINKAVEQISIGPIDADTRNPEALIIKKLTIDLFGFSRGAASARYCVHQLLRDERHNMRTRLTNLGFEVEVIELCFVGLFDTVSAYKSMQIFKILPLENWFVKLESVREAQKIVHLASAEEHRYHFSLHNIRSAGGKGEQYFLPGVHSDIGGGYLDNGSDAGLVVCEAHRHWAQKDRSDYLVANGWYKDEQLIEEVISRDENNQPDYVRLVVTREAGKARIVRNAYCKIPLKLMAECAAKSGIQLKPKLEEDSTNTINSFPELTRLEAKIRAYIGKVGPRGSKPEDWQKSDPELNLIRHKHLHFSARYNTFFGHNPRRTLLGNRRERYEFDG